MVFKRLTAWAGTELATHLHLLILVIYALYIFIVNKESRTLSNELLFMIAIAISLSIHNDMGFKREIRDYLKKHNQEEKKID